MQVNFVLKYKGVTLDISITGTAEVLQHQHSNHRLWKNTQKGSRLYLGHSCSKFLLLQEEMKEMEATKAKNAAQSLRHPKSQPIHMKMTT